MEQYGVPYESDIGQMTEERLGYLDHLNMRSSYSNRLCECYCKSYAVEFGVPAVIARLAQTFWTWRFLFQIIAYLCSSLRVP